MKLFLQIWLFVVVALAGIGIVIATGVWLFSSGNIIGTIIYLGIWITLMVASLIFISVTE